MKKHKKQRPLRHKDIEVHLDNSWMSLEEWCNRMSRSSFGRGSFLFLADGRADFDKFTLFIDDNERLVVEPHTGILASFSFFRMDWRMKKGVPVRG